MMEHCKKLDRDFPGGLMVKILTFQCRGIGSIPGQGTKTLHAMREGQKTKINKIKKKKRTLTKTLVILELTSNKRRQKYAN